MATDCISKAAAYAALVKAHAPLVDLGGGASAFVTDSGELIVRHEDVRIVVTAVNALVLRDWLTDIFDIPCEPVAAPISEPQV